MNLNQISAKMDIVNSFIRSIQTNCKMMSISEENKREFGIDIKYMKPFVKNDIIFGSLLMKVHVTVKNSDENNEPDEFDVVAEGIFRAKSDVPEDEFIRMLNINGAAALYSIVRSKIEMLSAMTYSEGKITLPMINIVQYYEEKNKSDNSKKNSD